MCGIVGLFLKDAALEPQLGALLTKMLSIMSDRGPELAGFAVFGDAIWHNKTDSERPEILISPR